jgi:hypothetical protein
MSKE